MLSKNRIKQISSLQQKKFRQETSTFVVEGHKSVMELLRSNVKVVEIVATADWIVQYAKHFRGVAVSEGSGADLERISSMKAACDVVAVVEMRDTEPLTLDKSRLYLALDSIRDPGNFGTILRIANWFGIGTVLASEDCVDLYNPKVVQASMGSVFRVDVHYCDLAAALTDAQKLGMPVYGTFLDGENIYTADIGCGGVVVLGNEGHGILPETERCITRRLLIPSGSSPDTSPESLNVAAATAVVCSEFYRRRF